jgi:hypothetical protein
MPQAADITVKKADGTTNVTWTLVSASGGDKTPALWRNTSAPGTNGQKPWFQCQSKWNGDRTARRVDVQGFYPNVYTDTTTSLTQVQSQRLISASFVLPNDLPTSVAQEAAAQLPNLIASALMEATFASGFAPV